MSLFGTYDANVFAEQQLKELGCGCASIIVVGIIAIVSLIMLVLHILGIV